MKKKALATDINVGNKAAGHGSNVPMQPNIPQMPSNTSNALDALADAYKGRSNALENQTKWDRMMLHLAELQLTYSPDWGANGQGDQKLYDFVTELIDEFSGWDVPDTNVGETISRQAAIEAVQNRPFMLSKEKVLLINDLEKLPSAQPEKRTETHACDSISRQAAIKALDKRFDSIPMEQTTAILLLRRDLRELPPTNTSEYPNSSDTISRQAAIDALNRECCCGAVIDHCGLETDMDIISELPPAEPKRIRGRWTCDQCGYMNNIEGINFCPKCGRKM